MVQAGWGINIRPISTTNKAKKAGGMGQVVEHLRVRP
jgi:hypothetical protein